MTNFDKFLPSKASVPEPHNKANRKKTCLIWAQICNQDQNWFVKWLTMSIYLDKSRKSLTTYFQQLVENNNGTYVK